MHCSIRIYYVQEVHKPSKTLRCNSGLWRFFQCPPADLNNQDRSQTRDFLSTSWLRQVFLVVLYFELNSPHISRYQVSLTTRHSQLLHHAAYIINGIKGIALYAKCHYAHCLWHLNTFSKRDYFVCPSLISFGKLHMGIQNNPCTIKAKLSIYYNLTLVDTISTLC